jgi:hypothetical protein
MNYAYSLSKSFKTFVVDGKVLFLFFYIGIGGFPSCRGARYLVESIDQWRIAKIRMFSCTARQPSRPSPYDVTTDAAISVEHREARDRKRKDMNHETRGELIKNLERQVYDLAIRLQNNDSGKMEEKKVRRNDRLEQENALLRVRVFHAVQGLGTSEGSGNVMLGAEKEIFCRLSTA